MLEFGSLTPQKTISSPAERKPSPPAIFRAMHIRQTAVGEYSHRVTTAFNTVLLL